MSIDSFGTKDPDSKIWFMFQPEGLPQGEVITAFTFLIDGSEVSTQGDAVNGLTFNGRGLFNDQNMCVLLEDGNIGEEYVITLRFSTGSIPSQDISGLLQIAEQ